MQGNGVRMAIFLFKWIGGEREGEREITSDRWFNGSLNSFFEVDYK